MFYLLIAWPSWSDSTRLMALERHVAAQLAKGRVTIEYSLMESMPMTVTWKLTAVGRSSFLGGRILSYILASSGRRSTSSIARLDLRVHCTLINDRLSGFLFCQQMYPMMVQNKVQIIWRRVNSIANHQDPTWWQLQRAERGLSRIKW